MDKIFIELTSRTDRGARVTTLIAVEYIISMKRRFVEDNHNSTEIGTVICMTQGIAIYVEDFLCSIKETLKNSVTIRKV